MIYIDYHATTPCSDEVLQLMNEFHSKQFANIGSAHDLGQASLSYFKTIEAEVLNHSKLPKAKLLYTSGATESINIAHLGLLDYCKRYNKQIISSTIEHKATLNTLSYMQEQGVHVEYLQVDQNGRIDLNQLKDLLEFKETALLSLIHANNEIGVVQDEQACIAMAKEQGAWVHLDISQSLCVQESLNTFKEADMLSFSGHKIYGPKGIGGLIINETSSKRVPLKAVMFGGGEQNSLTPGTHPTALAAGLCKALDETFKQAARRKEHFLGLKKNFISALKTQLDHWSITGNLDYSLPHNIHLNFEGINHDIVGFLKKIAVSSGSTCSSKSKQPSHVLKAIGMSDKKALSSIRLGLGIYNTIEHMDTAAKDIANTVKRMREKTSI